MTIFPGKQLDLWSAGAERSGDPALALPIDELVHESANLMPASAVLTAPVPNPSASIEPEGKNGAAFF